LTNSLPAPAAEGANLFDICDLKILQSLPPSTTNQAISFKKTLFHEHTPDTPEQLLWVSATSSASTPVILVMQSSTFLLDQSTSAGKETKPT
jgi:hypothetical protein